MIANQWFTARELADLDLPGLPSTARAFQLLVIREGWLHANAENILWRKRTGRGGGREFHVRALPLLAQVTILLRTDLSIEIDAGNAP